MAVDGADPRVFDQMDAGAEAPVGSISTVRPQHRKLYDPNVSFEEYYYYAQQTRAAEAQQPKTSFETSVWSVIFPSKSGPGVAAASGSDNIGEKKTEPSPHERVIASDDEWANASRALRTATRGAVFYLITTDILGPFGLPYAFATMGWG